MGLKPKLLLGVGLLSLLLVASLTLIQWNRVKNLVKVNAGLAKITTIQEEVDSTGTVQPISRQEIRSLNPGRVVKVFVRIGDKVQSGQSLVVLDSTLADAQVAQARTSLATAVKNRDTASGQSQQVLSQAQSAVDQAQMALKVAIAEKDQLTLKSNLNGTVINLNTQEGDVVSPQVPLVVIAELDKLKIEADLNEIDAGKIQVGQVVRVTGKILGGNEVKGIVTAIAPIAESKPSAQGNVNPTVNTQISLDQIPPGLKPGLTMNIALIIATKEKVLAIPQEAIVQEINKNFVYRLENGKAHKIEIKTGLADDLNQEILAGLNSNDRIALNPTDQFYDGMPIQIIDGSETG